MPVYKNKDNGTWYVMTQYTDWKGERKATVLYFALEDDYPRLQKRLFQMFGAEETDNLYFATECKTVSGGLEKQIRGFIGEHPRHRLDYHRHLKACA